MIPRAWKQILQGRYKDTKHSKLPCTGGRKLSMIVTSIRVAYPEILLKISHTKFTFG
jgi:hypothetical protein